MANTQQTLIYINEEHFEEAKFMSRNFVDKEVRTRAYLNTLGAEIIKSYLTSEGINTVNLHNIHSISKILENNDIADILLPNIHIDVRVIFDEEQIFIPKSHFEKKILPNIYAVIKIDNEYKTAEFLGYFLPEIIDKKQANKDYYFITSKQLISTNTFIKTIKDFVGKAPRNISEEDMLRGRELAVSLNDHNLTASEEKELLELLFMSDSLRESVLEFDNFETLAHSASAEVMKNIDVPAIPPAEEKTDYTNPTNQDEDPLGDKLLEEEDIKEEPEEVSEQEKADEKETETSEKTEEPLPEPNTPLQEVHAVKTNKDNMSVDAILDRTIAAIDKKPEQSIEDKKVNLASNIVAALGTAAGTAAAAAAATEATKAAATAETISAVSDNAMKLASVAGDINTEEPLDIEKVNKVESIASKTKEQNFKHETVDMNSMDVVNEGNIDEDHAESLSDMETLMALEGGVNPEDDFAEMQGISESEVVDLPMSSSYTINDDGTSNMDMFNNMNVPIDDQSELIDIPPLDGTMNSLDFGIGEISISEQDTLPSDNSIVRNTPAIEEEEVVENTITEPETLNEETIAEEELPEIGNISTTTEELNIGQEPEPLEQEELTEPIIDSIEHEQEAVQEIVSDTISDTAQTEVNEPEIDLTEDLIDNSTIEAGLETNLQEEDLTVSDEIVEVGEELLPTEELASTPETSDETTTETVTTEQTESQMTEELSEPITATEDTEDINNTPEQPAQEEDELDKMLEEETQQPTDFQDTISDFITEEQDSTEDTEDWLNDTAYSDIADIADTTPQNTEDIITEPTPVTVNAKENSLTISDKTFSIGEIPIDINNYNGLPADNTPLGNLYTSNTNTQPQNTILNNPGTMGAYRNKKSKAPVILGIFGALVVLIIVGVVGFFAAKMFKTPTMEEPQPITDDNVPTSTDNGVGETNTLNVNKDNVINMDNNTNALASTATNPQNSARKTSATSSFTEIKKLSWEVPDYISYDANFRQYFQSVGKSLKLALTSDLLLATDFIYSSPVKVSVTFTQDGSFKNSQVLNSSGSTQIDSIVLQTVNQTLKSVKAPRSVGNDESTTAILKIYF